MQMIAQGKALLPLGLARQSAPAGSALRLPIARLRSGSGRPCRRAVMVHAAELQSQDMERWEAGVRDGRVRNISCADVISLQRDGWLFLDVRPPGEMERAPIKGAVHVPLFVPEESNDIGALIKKATDFGMGSWWLGGTHYIPNPKFMSEVLAKVPRDSRIIVACQKGLRSLAACEQLSRSGFPQVAWINGGLDTARKGQVPTTNDVDVRFAGIGGLSEVIGWTEVQREETQGKSAVLGGLDGVIKLFAAILLADLALFAYEQIVFMTGQAPPL